MVYISRALRRIGNNINHLFRRHEPIQEYSIGGPGYKEHAAPPEPVPRSHDDGADLPGFDPNAWRYKHKIGEEAPTVGQGQKAEAEHIPSPLGRRAVRKAKVKKNEYISAGIQDGEEEKKRAACGVSRL